MTCTATECILSWWYYVCSFLLHMVMMFPFTGQFPEAFSFNGSSVLAESSNDDVHSIHIAHSCISNHSVASLNVSLDSQGFKVVIQRTFHFNKQMIYLHA